MNSKGHHLRWGIIAPGRIAHKFATGLSSSKSGRLTAVASRDIERAEAFKTEYEADFAFDKYQELAESDEVDAIYIASPHVFHLEQTLLCLKAGKAVLCEKPMGVNSRQVQDMVNVSRDNNIFLMEAMWTRFLPAVRKAMEWIKAGKIGTPMLMRGQFCFNAPYDPQSRLYDPRLGGGGLLDVGIYVLAMANQVFGSDLKSNQSAFIPSETGVDQVSAGTLQYSGGGIVQWASAVGLRTEHTVVIYGDKGYLHIPNFWQATRLELCIEGKDEMVWDEPLVGNGYNYQADEVAKCIAAGLRQSEMMPHSDSLHIHHVMDQAREDWGLKYPTE